MEQANYTNKYLQVLGDTLKTKISKQKTIEEASTSIPIEKPLFKPFKISDKDKNKNELKTNIIMDIQNLILNSQKEINSRNNRSGIIKVTMTRKHTKMSYPSN